MVRSAEQGPASTAKAVMQRQERAQKDWRHLAGCLVARRRYQSLQGLKLTLPKALYQNRLAAASEKNAQLEAALQVKGVELEDTRQQRAQLEAALQVQRQERAQKDWRRLVGCLVARRRSQSLQGLKLTLLKARLAADQARLTAASEKNAQLEAALKVAKVWALQAKDLMSVPLTPEAPASSSSSTTTTTTTTTTASEEEQEGTTEEELASSSSGSSISTTTTTISDLTQAPVKGQGEKAVQPSVEGEPGRSSFPSSAAGSCSMGGGAGLKQAATLSAGALASLVSPISPPSSSSSSSSSSPLPGFARLYVHKVGLDGPTWITVVTGGGRARERQDVLVTPGLLNPAYMGEDKTPHITPYPLSTSVRCVGWWSLSVYVGLGRGLTPCFDHALTQLSQQQLRNPTATRSALRTGRRWRRCRWRAPSTCCRWCGR
jgi:microcompartment protein CcmK/EutM